MGEQQTVTNYLVFSMFSRPITQITPMTHAQVHFIWIFLQVIQLPRYVNLIWHTLQIRSATHRGKKWHTQFGMCNPKGIYWEYKMYWDTFITHFWCVIELFYTFLSCSSHLFMLLAIFHLYKLVYCRYLNANLFILALFPCPELLLSLIGYGPCPLQLKSISCRIIHILSTKPL